MELRTGMIKCENSVVCKQITIEYILHVPIFDYITSRQQPDAIAKLNSFIY